MTERPAPPLRVPTLTEVVQVEDAPAPAPALTAVPAPEATVVDAAPINETEIVQRVLHDVQRQIDLMLEYRLRESLGPMLARLSDMVIREARNELASTLRDVVARAVSQELSRNRGR